MTDIAITGMNIARNATAWPNGSKLIAHFDLEARGFAFNGCLLIKTTKLGFTIRLPKTEDHRGAFRTVGVIDASLQHQIMDAARKAYIALGGKGGEWTPSLENE